jgi:Amidases related to nicotinamidase
MTNTPALLVIDVQEAMFQLEEPPYNADQMVANIQRLLQEARSRSLPVIYVRHAGLDERSPLHPSKPGWPIYSAIAPQAGEPIVDKQHSDSFWDTNLHALLNDLGVRKLIITGMQTDYCVDTTCRRALSLGYEVTLVSDAHSTWGNGVLTAEQIVQHHNQTLGDGFATLRSTDQLTSTNQLTW